MKNAVNRLLSRGLLFGVLSLLAIGALYARAQETAPAIKAPIAGPPAPSPAENVPLAVLPFEMEDSWDYFIAAAASNRGGRKVPNFKRSPPTSLDFRFGADGSGLAEETFAERKLPLPPPQKDDTTIKIRGIGNGNDVSARLLTDIKYAVGDISFNDTPVLASLGELHKMRIDGLLGAGVFRALVVEVDYARKTIVFSIPASFRRRGRIADLRAFLCSGSRDPGFGCCLTAFGFVKRTAQLEIDTGH